MKNYSEYDMEWMDLPVEEVEIPPVTEPVYFTKLTLTNENGRYEIEVPKGELTLHYIHWHLIEPILLAAGYDNVREFYDEG